jgi:MEDS: MEthanogen/methylotroph, DcmR Sensory domain
MAYPVLSGIDEIELQPGSHVCAFYRGEADRDRLLTGYLGAGLTAGDKCICVVDSPYTAKRLAALRPAPADLNGNGAHQGPLYQDRAHGNRTHRNGADGHRADGNGVHRNGAGQLDVYLPETTYLAGGGFSTSDMLTFWAENMAKAEVEGYTFCRLVGEMTWALRDAPGVEHLIGYESELNRVTASSPVIVLCLYDLDLFNGEVVVNVVKTHPQVLIQGILIENPYYVEPDEYLGSAHG